ncbi:MAG: Rrf2 family transcriptional regulator [Candidatus Omnitrophica bacterium]|nr:Rrf2 family transcriptional regulator [Candidatus Omnitrophota bacterium]
MRKDNFKISLDKMILIWYHLVMRLITRNTDYAIKALCFIARNNGGKNITPVSELARALKIPRPFLRKILQILNKRKIVNSYKGAGGGFSLAVPADRMYLVDVMRIFQGPLKLTKCVLKERICPDVENCLLRAKIGVIENYIISELKAITLASLLNGK